MHLPLSLHTIRLLFFPVHSNTIRVHLKLPSLGDLVLPIVVDTIILLSPNQHPFRLHPFHTHTTHLIVWVVNGNMVITTIPIVQRKRSISTISKIVGISIGKSESVAARVVTVIGDEGPLAGVLAFDPGHVVFGAFEAAGGEFGGAGYDGGGGALDESEAGDGEEGGEFHGCRLRVLRSCLIAVWVDAGMRV